MTFDDNKTANAILIAMLLMAFTAYSLISYCVFDNYPMSMDEYNYWYQAQIFASGKTHLSVEGLPGALKEGYMIWADGKAFTKYGPGFSLILSLGVMVGVPGLVNPFLAALTLLFLFLLVRSFVGTRYGLIVLLLAATSPSFWGYAASYFAHSLSLFLSTLSFYLIRQFELSKSPRLLILLGFTFGYAIVTRAADAFCLIVPCAIYLLILSRRAGSMRQLAYVIVPLALMGMVFASYNYYLSGHFSFFAYDAGSSEAGRFTVNKKKTSGNQYLENAQKFMSVQLGKYFSKYTGYVLPVLAILGLLFFKESRSKWVFFAQFFLLVAIYNFVSNSGWPAYGARYYYAGFSGVMALVGFGLFWLASLPRKRFLSRYLIFTVIISTLGIHLYLSHLRLKEYRARFVHLKNVVVDIERVCPEKSIVVLEPVTKYSPNIQFMPYGELRRNPFYNGSRLYVRTRDQVPNVKKHFPDYQECGFPRESS